MRGVKMARRWITTLAIFDADGRQVVNEGHWYDGPVASAIAMTEIEQSDYAFYSDDGSKSTATIIGTKGAQQTLEVDTTYHCRLEFTEVGGADGDLKQITWQYNHEAGGWTAITASSTAVQAVTTGNLTNDDDCNQRISSGNYDATNAMVTTDGTSNNNALLSGDKVEGLLAFQIVGGAVSDADEILIRVLGAADGTPVFADIDVNKEAPTGRRRSNTT
jgi:hypothetical protein